MGDSGIQAKHFLVVNRAQVVECSCSACGGHFAQNPTGDKALIATVAENAPAFFFCAGCGENIMGRVTSEEARAHYSWDWAIPLRNGANH